MDKWDDTNAISLVLVIVLSAGERPTPVHLKHVDLTGVGLVCTVTLAALSLCLFMVSEDIAGACWFTS